MKIEIGLKSYVILIKKNKRMASEVSTSLKEHVDQLVTAFNSAVKVSQAFHEAKGKDPKTKKIQLDGAEITSDDVKNHNKSIRENIKKITKIVADERRAEKQRKREKNGDRKNKVQPPSLYSSSLVNFFKKADLGKGGNGKRLQDQPEMKFFFENGVANLIFGVSLFNVWGNICKLNSGSSEVKLDAHAKAALREAIEHLKAKKRAIITSNEVDITDKARETAQNDLEALEADKVQNKDYMGIWSFYTDRERSSSTDLSGYSEVVSNMCEITASLNKGYRDQLNSNKAPKLRKAPKAPEPTPEPVAVVSTKKTSAPVPSVVAVPRATSTGKRGTKA
jgi:hypothetical protein